MCTCSCINFGTFLESRLTFWRNLDVGKTWAIAFAGLLPENNRNNFCRTLAWKFGWPENNGQLVPGYVIYITTWAISFLYKSLKNSDLDWFYLVHNRFGHCTCKHCFGERRNLPSLQFWIWSPSWVGQLAEVNASSSAFVVVFWRSSSVECSSFVLNLVNLAGWSCSWAAITLCDSLIPPTRTLGALCAPYHIPHIWFISLRKF